MSKDETGSNEGQGIPGFSANNSIPGGFTLPIPTATAGAAHEDEAPADPWSSTWEDTSWQSGDTGQQPAVGAAGDSSTNQWTDSYEYGGEYGSDTATPTSAEASTNGHDHGGSSTTSWTDWE